MCLLLVAFKQHPRFPFIMAANRDEFYDRPAAAARFWDDEARLLAGRDLQGGGTWCGITRGGRFAALTNYREPGRTRAGAPSRGALVAEYLTGRASPDAYLAALEREADLYNGFNLFVGDVDRLLYFSNRGGAVRVLDQGLFGISNHLLDTSWPKVERGKTGLRNLIEADTVDTESLFALLSDRSRPPDDALPDTGVGPDWERILASMHIESAAYGTRAATVGLVSDTGTITFAERTYAGVGAPKGTVQYTLPLEPHAGADQPADAA